MILDTSIIVSVFLKEAGYEQLAEMLNEADVLGIGAPTLAECGIVLSARLKQDARGLLTRFLTRANITIIPFGEAHYEVAMSAWLKFGKGRHKAGLNFGDCMSYATAKVAGMPLFFIGSDFPHTDLKLVTLS